MARSASPGNPSRISPEGPWWRTWSSAPVGLNPTATVTGIPAPAGVDTESDAALRARVLLFIRDQILTSVISNRVSLDRTHSKRKRLLAEHERSVQANMRRTNSLNSGHRACQGCGEALGALGPERVAPVEIVDGDRCGRFSSTVLSGVVVTQSAPWMQRRLSLAGAANI